MPTNPELYDQRAHINDQLGHYSSAPEHVNAVNMISETALRNGLAFRQSADGSIDSFIPIVPVTIEVSAREDEQNPLKLNFYLGGNKILGIEDPAETIRVNSKKTAIVIEKNTDIQFEAITKRSFRDYVEMTNGDSMLGPKANEYLSYVVKSLDSQENTTRHGRPKTGLTIRARMLDMGGFFLTIPLKNISEVAGLVRAGEIEAPNYWRYKSSDFDDVKKIFLELTDSLSTELEK